MSFHVGPSRLTTGQHKGEGMNDRALCGCVRTIIDQRTISLCPTHTVGPMACCPEASRRQCVCMYSYSCPTHGEQHIGSHD
jgi:hypothetical protein